MAIGMLLTMLVSNHKPPANVVNMWLDCLLHDDITIRCIAFQVNKKSADVSCLFTCNFLFFQAVECILKLYKVKKQRKIIDTPSIVINHPGKGLVFKSADFQVVSCLFTFFQEVDKTMLGCNMSQKCLKMI